MIVRTWHGITTAEKADEYVGVLQATVVPNSRAKDGNRGMQVWRRLEGDRAHFLTVSLWDSLDSIKNFAGENIEVAVYYPEDKDYLLEFEPTVTHYEVVVSLTD